MRVIAQRGDTAFLVRLDGDLQGTARVYDTQLTRLYSSHPLHELLEAGDWELFEESDEEAQKKLTAEDLAAAERFDERIAPRIVSTGGGEA
jgi:hypothetical protein